MRNWAWPQPCRKRELNTTPVVAVGHGRGAGGRRWGMAAVPVGGGGAWPGFEATRRATSATRRHWCGGHRRDPWAWLRCPWTTRPGRVSRRRAEQHQQPGATGVEGAGGICRGAGGRWRGLAGLVTAHWRHWCGGRRRARRARAGFEARRRTK